MKNGILVSAFSILCLSAQTFACDIQGKSGFMPENKLRISKFSKDRNDMTKEKFEAIINRVFENYSPIVKAKGALLEIEKNWDDDTVNAYANQIGSTWSISMYGGLARHPFVTDDGLMLVVCHETGHHLGGAPKYYGGTDWASTEGQADYFGSLKCMKRVLEKDDNITIVAGMTIDEEATKQCASVYKNAGEIALCQRIAMAGKSIAQLLGELGGNSKIAFTTPDKTVVKQTYENHPKAQCRLDTYFHGILCDKPFSEDVSETSPVPGTCIKSDGYLVGPRPLCWYKPGCDEITGSCLASLLP